MAIALFLNVVAMLHFQIKITAPEIFKKMLTTAGNHCIIYEHELSDEAECGYILTENKDGGNFSGVCHGKDQAVSF